MAGLYDVRVKVEVELEYTLAADDQDDAALQAEYMAFSAYDPGADAGLNVYTLAVSEAEDDAQEAVS